MCTLELLEWDWRRWHAVGKPRAPQEINNKSITKGKSFHLECRVYDLGETRERTLNWAKWCDYGFIPYIELIKSPDNKPIKLNLTPIPSNEGPKFLWSSFCGGKGQPPLQVPPEAFGKIDEALSSIEVGNYKITIIMKFSNGTLRSNTVNFSVVDK